MRNLQKKKKRLIKKLNRNRFIEFEGRPKPTERRILFTFLTMMICFGISAYVGCTEFVSLPRTTETGSIAGNPAYEQPDWSYTAGDHMVSALENAMISIGGFFGFLRLIDLMLLFYREDPEQFMKILNDKE